MLFIVTHYLQPKGAAEEMLFGCKGSRPTGPHIFVVVMSISEAFTTVRDSWMRLCSSSKALEPAAKYIALCLMAWALLSSESLIATRSALFMVTVGLPCAETKRGNAGCNEVLEAEPDGDEVTLDGFGNIFATLFATKSAIFSTSTSTKGPSFCAGAAGGRGGDANRGFLACGGATSCGASSRRTITWWLSTSACSTASATLAFQLGISSALSGQCLDEFVKCLRSWFLQSSSLMHDFTQARFHAAAEQLSAQGQASMYHSVASSHSDIADERKEVTDCCG